jgi:hypothetical protein
MAAYDGVRDVPAGGVLRLTDGASAVSMQILDGGEIEIIVQNGTTAPALSAFADRGWKVYFWDRFVNAALTDLAPGVTSPNEVFATSRGGARVRVSHA